MRCLSYYSEHFGSWNVFIHGNRLAGEVDLANFYIFGNVLIVSCSNLLFRYWKSLFSLVTNLGPSVRPRTQRSWTNNIPILKQHLNPLCMVGNFKRDKFQSSSFPATPKTKYKKSIVYITCTMVNVFMRASWLMFTIFFMFFPIHVFLRRKVLLYFNICCMSFNYETYEILKHPRHFGQVSTLQK